MPRSVDAIQGLGLLGRATLGPFSVECPTVLRSEDCPGRASTEAIYLSKRESPQPGTRVLAFHNGGKEVEISYPILTPETSSPDSAMQAGPGIWMVHWPIPASGWERLRGSSPELVVLSNSRALFSEGEPFVQAVGELRRQLGAGPLLWTPRVTLPHRVAFLVYAGVDLLDSTEAGWRAAEGAFLDRQIGPRTDVGIATQSCSCSACGQGGGPDLSGHAILAIEDEIRWVRGLAGGGRLRELVEARLSSEPALAEMLRYADRNWKVLLEERTPTVGRGIRSYVITDSHRRPEVLRFRHRFIERYRPPASKTVLVLVPCSRTKPYRLSRTHRRLSRAFDGIAQPHRFHIVSVTSPLGLVPRELEDVFPARNYDIPVTGEWDASERTAVRTALAHLLVTGHYRAIVVHLDANEYSFLSDAFPADRMVRWTAADEGVTSPTSIARLSSELRDRDAEEPPLAGGVLASVREELGEVAAFQFGRDPAASLFQSPIRLAGRPWFQRLTDGRGTDLASWREERGFFHLTIAGAARLGRGGVPWVQIDPDLRLKGDLFTPGVRNADPSIRTGDAVALYQDSTLTAVGEAVLPGPIMTPAIRGLAVRVRHRYHPRSDADDPTPK